MGRLKQINSNNYGASRNIHDEFENVIRYLVAAERGNQSFAEMFKTLFDAEGKVQLNVQFTYDGDGLKMRGGGHEDWTTLATPEQLRGTAGRDIGNVHLPILTGYASYEIEEETEWLSYVHSDTDIVFVHKNGLLLQPAIDYYTSPSLDRITFVNAVDDGDIVSVYKMRGDAGVVINRNDFTVTAPSQVVFGVIFPHNQYQAQVFLNGVLLAENADYILSPQTNSLTLLEPAITSDVLTTVFITATEATEVPGFLIEGIYTDMKTGLIPYNKLGIPDGAIPSAKVDGLNTRLDASARMHVGSGTPTDPQSGDFWLDTSKSPANLKVYDASEFVSVQPVNTLPTVKSTDATNAVFVNSTGTGFIYAPLDFSALIPASAAGQPTGIATLDEDGRLDPSQFPAVRTRDVISLKLSGDYENGTHTIRRLFGERFRIIGLSVRSGTGSCTIQLAISGTAVGNTYSAAPTANDQTFSSVIEVDALVLSKTLDVIVTAESSGANLDVSIVIERLI